MHAYESRANTDWRLRAFTDNGLPTGRINFRFGSLADLLTDSSLTTAFAWKADVHVGQF